MSGGLIIGAGTGADIDDAVLVEVGLTIGQVESLSFIIIECLN